MKVLLDTNALSALWNGDERVLDALGQAECVFMSIIVLGELFVGFRGGTRMMVSICVLPPSGWDRRRLAREKRGVSESPDRLVKQAGRGLQTASKKSLAPCSGAGFAGTLGICAGLPHLSCN